MAVPAHDERDFEFSKKYDLPIPRVIKLIGSTDADDAPVEVAVHREGRERRVDQFRPVQRNDSPRSDRGDDGVR